MNNRVYQYFKFVLFYKKQSGFGFKHSTTDALVELTKTVVMRHQNSTEDTFLLGLKKGLTKQFDWFNKTVPLDLKT